jgi:hypothetical protein
MASALAAGEVECLARPGRPNAKTPFFISYAHTTAASDEMANRLYHALRGYIQTLVHAPVGTALGFFDQDGIDPAVLWDEELAQALGSCQVLVALVCPPYLNREWCGKEWHAFAMREKTSRSGGNASRNLSAILPVLWAPVPYTLPEAVARHQFFAPTNTTKQPNLAKAYETDGLYRLLEDDKDASSTIIWQLARRIQEVYYSQELLPREFKQADLVNVFEGDTP